MKLVTAFGLMVFCLFHASHATEDKESLLARIESMKYETQASINKLRSLKRDFLIDLKYLLFNVKTDNLQRIDSSIKETMYRIKRATKTGNVVDCDQSSIENSNLPATKILNKKCWRINMESIYGPIYDDDELVVRPIESGNAEKCYDVAESSIERLLLMTRLDLTKCLHKSLESALNLTTRAENLVQDTGYMVVDRLNTIQEECQTADDDEESKNRILHRIYNIDPYAKVLKRITNNLLNERTSIKVQAIIDADSCRERQVADTYKILSQIEKTANTCIRSL
ncbi:hypothetical protein TSAR_013417 [Trichomalopsis sarcophagae]|uniref:Protein TsetseEP domain-containing protein n=1 Tax=Trichomalopsis sarcophagae TaxID=543379 RepID=A0A232F7G4_9HYME|nr:hypothetical protein TSAR_013417 [Trichomalopsis sarcophagae]